MLRQDGGMTYQTILRNHTDFPDCLRQMKDPPGQLHWTGQLLAGWLERPRVVIVGSRRVSGYGRQVALQLALELAQAGIVIISDLAARS